VFYTKSKYYFYKLNANLIGPLFSSVEYLVQQRLSMGKIDLLNFLSSPICFLAGKFWRENFGGKILAGKFWQENFGRKILAGKFWREILAVKFGGKTLAG
jgi:hypothetical protein